MAETKELKPKSFRIDDQTAEKIKEISSEIGGNQQETLAKLIESYEFQKGKAILTEKKADIEQFETYVNALTRMYMGSLEENQMMADTIRTEFDALLKSKDTTIQDLQTKLTVAKQLKEEAAIKATSYKDEIIRLNTELENRETDYNSRMEDLQEMLEDKDKLNKALTDSCYDLKQKVNEGQQGQEELRTLRTQQAELMTKQEKLEKENVTLKQKVEQAITRTKEKEIELEQQKNRELTQLKEQSQLILDKTVLELERNYQEQIQKLKEQKQKEVDKYQHKYFELLEQLKETTKETKK